MNRLVIMVFLFALITVSMIQAQTQFLLGVCTHFSAGKGQLNSDLRLI
jgi:hypothetical protein